MEPCLTTDDNLDDDNDPCGLVRILVAMAKTVMNYAESNLEMTIANTRDHTSLFPTAVSYSVTKPIAGDSVEVVGDLSTKKALKQMLDTVKFTCSGSPLDFHARKFCLLPPNVALRKGHKKFARLPKTNWEALSRNL